VTDATDLWAAIVVSYDDAGLVSLTNIRDNAATVVDATIGADAAQEVINFFPIFAQIDYDSTNATHVSVAKQGVIAVLWRRGGSSSTIAEVKWDSVFADDGLLSKVRRTGPRGHRPPSSNSGVTTKRENADGGNVRGWSDPESLPVGYLPRRKSANG
jgi:hypothetical protein